MHIDRISDRAEQMARRIFGPPKALPADNPVLNDLARARAAALARDREDAATAASRLASWHHVDANGRVRLTGPIPQPAPGTYPDGWRDVFSDEYRQDDE